MAKILSISEMEKSLLADSDINDVITGFAPHQSPNQVLSQAEVKREVSALARLLIRAYVGWPVHDEIVKRQVLTQLTRIYRNAHDMSVQEFFDLVRPVISVIPDNHITLGFKGSWVKSKFVHNHINVGENIAGTNTVATKMLPGNIAAIGFTRMLKTDEVKATIIDFAKNMLPQSSALIVDLRGNHGGSSYYSDLFAAHLCGTKIDSAKRVYLRTTPEAKKLSQNTSWANMPESDELVLLRTGENYSINEKTAYKKPIYILTDSKTGSSAEMFLLRMIHHPNVTVVGDNSAGMEAYGNMVKGHLPTSNINIAIGMNYRVLTQDNFETNGYPPDIKCSDGQDALTIAINDITRKQSQLEKSQHEM